MTKACMKWKDQLLETALGATAGPELESHLSRCADCAAELSSLRARRKRLDALLPRIAGAAEDSPDLRARILNGTNAVTTRQRVIAWPRWELASATVLLGAAGVIGWVLSRPTKVSDPELQKMARELSQWRAPSDVFLRNPGQEFLNAVPKLGDSYLTVPARAEKGEK